MRVIYKADAVVYGAKHTLRVNDIPFSRDMLGHPLSSEIPLNEFLTNGSIPVDIELLPLDNEESLDERAEVKLIIKQYSYPVNADNFTTVFEHTLNADSIDDEPNYRFSGSFKATVPYADLGWVQSRPIDLRDSNGIEELYHRFEHLWQLFEKKDVGRVLSAFDAKFNDFERCYYLDRGNRKAAAKEKLESVFGDSGYELGPFDRKMFVPFLSAGGKLVTLLDKMQQHYHYINYYHPENRELVEFPVYLGRNAKDTIVVCL